MLVVRVAVVPTEASRCLQCLENMNDQKFPLKFRVGLGKVASIVKIYTEIVYGFFICISQK